MTTVLGDDSALAAIRIVLVEPSHPGNIGGAARALKTMGLSQLWLVNPKRFPDPQAQWRAAGGADVLDNAKVVDSVAAATADCGLVVGTSNRGRRIPWPVKNAEPASAEVVQAATHAPVAILFGREADGLSNEELRSCNLHLQIPANPDYPSLNLAMAVQVVCYELARQVASPPRTATADGTDHWDRPWAKHEQVERLIDHLEATLTDIGFLDDSVGQTMTRLRRLIVRHRFDETEVQMLRGVLKTVQKRFDPTP